MILTTGPLGAMVPGLGGACVAASWGAVFQGVGTPGLWGPWLGILDLCPAGLCLGTLSGKGLGLMGVDADAELDPYGSCCRCWAGTSGGPGVDDAEWGWDLWGSTGQAFLEIGFSLGMPAWEVALGGPLWACAADFGG